MDITIMLSRKLNEKYKKELLEQTDKYSYYLSTEKEIGKGKNDKTEGVRDKDPFSCVEINNTHRVYDAGDYFIYESVNGYSSDEERNIIVEESIKLNSDLTYSDIDFVTDDGKRHTPFFKPDWSPDTFDSIDYISDFFVIKKELIHEDVKSFDKITHITKTLFHCNSNDNDSDIYRFYAGKGVSPDYEGMRDESDESISIIIPSKDNPDLLYQCLNSLLRAKIKSGFNSKYNIAGKIEDIETIIVDNGSNEENRKLIAGVIKTFYELNITYIYEKEEFNFSKMCNRGVSQSKGKYLLFLNDDIEVYDDFFLIKLLHFARMDHVGAVAPKLYYPSSDIIQHTGITDLIKCGPSHKLSTHSDSEAYYFGYNKINRNTLAVTGACLMVSREKYFRIGGFYDKMKVGYNDVDLCISLYESGLFNVVVNDALLFHHESISRGSDALSEEKFLRLKSERDLLYERHPFLREKGDPFYNVNLIDDSLDYTVNVTPLCDDRSYRSEILDDCQDKEDGNNAINKADNAILRYVLKKIRSDKLTSSKNAYYNIENVSFERGLFGEKDALIVSGWALMNKKDNIYYDRYLLLRKKDGKNSKEDFLLFGLAKKYREDLSKVFPDSKNSLLSGFVSKIPMDVLKEKFGISNIDRIDEEIEYGIVFVSKATGIKYYAGK